MANNSFENSDLNESTSSLNDSTRSNEDRKKYSKAVNNTVPVMIRNVLSFKQFKNWGHPVHIVTFIGIVKRVEKTVNQMVYEIEDETGIITAFYWLESESMLLKTEVRLNMYVRIFGHVRKQHGETQIFMLKICAITELNELTSHLLEVTYLLLKLQKGFQSHNKSIDNRNAISMQTCNSFVGLTREQSIVFDMIRTEEEDQNGTDFSDIAARVPEDILPNLQTIIQFLQEEGHIYSEVSNNFYKIALN